LNFYGATADLRDSGSFQAWLSALYAQEWVVYCKPPFQNAGRVLEYLGRYTHRVAISNRRILQLEDGQVTFRWRDYKDGNLPKEMTLPVNEFLRRFLLHVLPKGFTSIRHYGFLSPRNKTTLLPRCQRLTHTRPVPPAPLLSALDLLAQITGRDWTLCPECGVGHLQRTRASPAYAIA
jgi:hypothetical protein